MKTRISMIIIAVLALIALPARAEFKIGVKGGVNISSVHFSQEILSKSNITGYNIGPMIEFVAPVVGVGVDAAALFNSKGVEIGDDTLRSNYLDIPVNLKWKFGLPSIKVYLAAGPYVSFKLGGDKIWNVIGEQWEAKSFGAGLNFGAGVELIKHLQVGFNYGLGLTENYSVNKVDLGKNRGWSITAAILF